MMDSPKECHTLFGDHLYYTSIDEYEMKKRKKRMQLVDLAGNQYFSQFDKIRPATAYMYLFGN